jgi:SAM-dependent methyltransferase
MRRCPSSSREAACGVACATILSTILPEELMSDHLDLLARVYSGRHTGLYPVLDESLNPRGPELLFDVAAEYLSAGARILDVGCRDAAYLIRLVQAHDATGLAVDPLERHVGLAALAVREAGLEDRIAIVKGVMEHIEEPNGSFDFIWCRDVLECVEGLDAGLAEAARLLKPDARMLIYTNFVTDLLEPQEAAKSFGPRGIVAMNMNEHRMEAAFLRASLIIERKDVIGTEWREYAEERSHPVSQDLLRLARLRRRRQEIIEEYGQDVYDRAEGALQWSAYQLLGKLQPTMYIVKLPN